MFNIDEIRHLCSVSNEDFYLSSRSSYEFLIYGDIDHFEIVVQSDLETWLLSQKHIEYKLHKDFADVIFLKEYFELRVYSLQGMSIDDYLNKHDFNFNAIAVKISHKIDRKAFACYKEKCSATWIDPFQVKGLIKSGYIKPLHIDDLKNNGHKLFKMVRHMIHFHLDIQEDVINALKAIDYVVNEDVYSDFFMIIKNPKSHKYLTLLFELGVLDKAYPIIHQMMDDKIWYGGLNDLFQFETIMTSQEYFSDGVFRHINRALSYEFDNGLTKYQMIKFSLLFKEAYKVMILKQNAPERYEESFTSFCEYFGFDEDSCHYYSQIIKSRNEISIDMSQKKITLEEQYEFYDEFQDQTIEVLLIYYINQIGKPNIKEYVEYLIMGYVSKYLEIQGINHEITTMDIQRHRLSDIQLTLLIEDVKKRIFYGNLRYDRDHIIDYLQKLIEQS